MYVGLAALMFVDFVGHYAAAACDVLRKLTLEGLGYRRMVGEHQRQWKLCAVRESVPGLVGKRPMDRW